MFGNILPTVLDTKCTNIYREERSAASKVVADVLGRFMPGTWDFIMPPVLVVNLLKHKRSSEGFILNLLFTKKLALEAARDMAEKNLTLEAAIQKADEATCKVLAADTRGIYSDMVRQKQLREIELLTRHYYSLIITEFKTYETMLKRAYTDRKAYLEFARQLSKAEREVNLAALDAVGKNDTSRKFVSKMQTSVENTRRLNAEKYFPDADNL
jgi:hypothetical protein